MSTLPCFRFGVRTLFLFIVLFLILPCMLFAQAEPAPTPAMETEESRDDIVVTATRIPENTIEVPQYVTTITAEDIEASGKSNVAEILAEEAGVSFYDYGYPGSMQAVWIRGATATRVLVLIDGIPTNNALVGQASWPLLPAEIIEKIEIVQGGLSIMYGSSAIGGVINIITKKGHTVESFLHLELENTSCIPQSYSDGGGEHVPDISALFDTQIISGSLAQDFGLLSVFLSGKFQSARNEYYFGNGSVVNRRENADTISGSAFSSISFPWTTGDLTLTGLYAQDACGVPGTLSSLSPTARQHDIQSQIIFGYSEDNFFSDKLSTTVKLSFMFINYLFEIPPGYESNSDIITISGDVSQEYRIVDFLSLHYGIQTTSDIVNTTEMQDKSRFNVSGFLSVPIILNNISISPAIRYDYYSGIDGEINYAIGFVFSLNDESSLKASFSKSFRVPTLNELYYPFDMGNPDLVPETSYAGEIGYSLVSSSLRIESAVFGRFMNDEIKLDPLWKPYNMARSFYTGAQAHIEYEVIPHLFAGANGTFIYSLNLSNGQTILDDVRLARVPMWQAQASLAWKDKSFSARLSCNVTGDQYIDDTLTDKLPPYITLDASLRYEVTNWLILTLALDNILNAQYQVVYDYPMSGLTIRFGMELKL